MAQRKFPDWATLDIPDIGNGDPNKQDPGATKQQEGWKVEKPFLQTMNWLQNLFGHFIRANNEVKVVATGYEAEAGEVLILDNSIAIASMNLPSAPIDGQWVKVSTQGLYSSFAATVNGNGNDIMEGANTSVELDMEYFVFTFWWDSTTSLWKVRADEIIGVKP